MNWLGLLLNWRVWAGVALAGLLAFSSIQTHRLKGAQASLASEKAIHAAFVEQVRAQGEQAAKEADGKIAKLKEVNRATANNYERRLGIINGEYGRLRDQHASSGSRPLPPDATTPAPTDDAARNDELLRVLRQAQEQTERLVGCQEWAKNLP